MKMMKKGLLGCDLKHQVASIGLLYSAMSVLALIFGFVLIQHPHYFADGALKQNEKMEDKMQENVIQPDGGNQNLEDMEVYYDSEMENIEEMDYGGPMEGDDSVDSEEIEYIDEQKGSVETNDDSTESEDQEHPEVVWCSGQDSHCCSPEDPCSLDEGDCDSDNDCKEGLVCGTDNCPVNSGPHWDAKDDCCQPQTDSCQTGNGGTYRGEMNQTMSGLTCQNWSSQSPNSHSHSEVGDHNNCRNPDGMEGVWCYTTENYTRWEYCQVISCQILEENESKKIENGETVIVDNTEEKVDNEEETIDGHFDPDVEIIGDSDESEEENESEENSQNVTEILDETELNEDSDMKNVTADFDSELTNLDDVNDNSERVKRDADYIEGMEEPIRNSSDPNEDISDGRKHYNLVLKFLKKEGAECVVAALLKLACSILLIMGVSQGKSWFLVPWLVEECLEMIGCLLQAMVSASHSKSWSVSGGLLFVLLYVIGGYSMYSVASYHGILRRMNAHSREIISSVSQGGFQSGMNYQRLEEECWQSQPNIVSEFREIGPGFVREKKVDMEENDEHVLYVQ